MVFDRRFEVGLAWRVVVVLAAFFLLVRTVEAPNLVAARIVAAIIVYWAIASLWTHIRRTNVEVARFIESVRFEDYSQRFAISSGGGFDVLGAALDDALHKLHASRASASEEVRFLSAVIDDAPVALLSITDTGVVDLLNKAARRQFPRRPVTHVDDFEAYGAELAAAMKLAPVDKRVSRIVLDGVARRILLATARVDRLGGGLTIAFILPVQTEFGAVELAAQADLVRIMTHEIMNSLTPVTSLARSCAELVARAAQRDPLLADAHRAAETVSSRSNGILRFVERYREFASSPHIRRQRFAARPWTDSLAEIVAADPKTGSAPLTISLEPENLRIDGDPDLLSQVLINLIRNAALATSEQPYRKIHLLLAATAERHVLIEVSDNGPGIARERRDDVFLPFYTTRAGGSGVGLSFARQVVLAHGGSIVADAGEHGGAVIRIVL